MVVFTCNNCGDSLKKNKVDLHLRQCRTRSLTCVDCQKDFDLQSYVKHIDCLTEDQKYGGLNYQQQEFKGKNKQNDWVQKIKALTNENNYPRDVQNILHSLVNYDNIPRKKPKFINFVKNSFRIRDDQLISKIWDIFESSIKSQAQTNQTASNGQTAQNGHENILKKRNVNEIAENGNVVNAVKKMKTELSQERKEKDECEGTKEVETLEPEQIKMKKVVKGMLGERAGEMSISKLRKKILKFYHKNGFTDNSEIERKFEKVINKNKFVINDTLISLATN